MKKLVYIGGGSSSFAILEGLKHDFAITAIVPVTDSGGSTGRLRDDLNMIPPGDIRQCLVALADNPLTKELLSYRFDRGDLMGHNFGNIFLAAVAKTSGDVDRATEYLKELFTIQGNIFPVAERKSTLVAKLNDGRVIRGESIIDEVNYSRPSGIRSVALVPAVALHKSARKAILAADVIVFSPGDLYTSLLANLAVRGMRQALSKSKATIIAAISLMTKYGQTDGYTVKKFIETIERYSGKGSIDVVIYNTEKPSRAALAAYHAQREYVVENDMPKDVAHPRIIGTPLISRELAKKKQGDVLKRSLLRHDPAKLARAIKHVLAR